MAGHDRIGSIEMEKRIRAVQEWIISDHPDSDIITSCMSMWDVSKRQSQRYIKEANMRVVKLNEKSLTIKRATRIQAVKKLLKGLPNEVLRTPGGVNAALRAHKYIGKLEAIEMTTQMVDAENAKDQGKPADPLAPTTSKLEIIVLPLYEGPETFNTTNTQS